MCLELQSRGQWLTFEEKCPCFSTCYTWGRAIRQGAEKFVAVESAFAEIVQILSETEEQQPRRFYTVFAATAVAQPPLLRTDSRQQAVAGYA